MGKDIETETGGHLKEALEYLAYALALGALVWLFVLIDGMQDAPHNEKVYMVIIGATMMATMVRALMSVHDHRYQRRCRIEKRRLDEIRARERHTARIASARTQDRRADHDQNEDWAKLHANRNDEERKRKTAERMDARQIQLLKDLEENIREAAYRKRQQR